MQDREIGDVGISAITYSELRYGVANSSNSDRNSIALAEFIAPLEVLDYTGEIAETYGSIRSTLKRKGKLIGPLDLLIAAHALHLESTLVTNNVREFSRIPKLKIENWTV
jgi:tRNA(fMet)-specific endonuclease VapC